MAENANYSRKYLYMNTLLVIILLLPPPSEVMFFRWYLFVCVSVCLFVSSITYKVMNGFAWHFYQMCVSDLGRIHLGFWMIWMTIRILFFNICTWGQFGEWSGLDSDMDHIGPRNNPLQGRSLPLEWPWLSGSYIDLLSFEYQINDGGWLANSVTWLNMTPLY